MIGICHLQLLYFLSKALRVYRATGRQHHYTATLLTATQKERDSSVTAIYT